MDMYSGDSWFSTPGTVYDNKANLPLLGSTNFEPIEISDGSDTGTFVGQKVVSFRKELSQIQDSIRKNNDELQKIRSSVISNAMQYHRNIGAIEAKLQVGTTPGNPNMYQALQNAQINIQTMNANTDSMGQLVARVSSDAAMTDYLLDSIRAAYSISGAVDEDHRQLRILENETNQTSILMNSLLSEATADEQRQKQYIETARNTMMGLGDAIKVGSYGVSNVPLMSSVVRPVSNKNLLVGTPSPSTSGKPLFTAKFNKGNVDYKDGIAKFLGNPTECALLVAASKSGFNYKEIREKSKIIYEYPFSSDTKNMTTVAKVENETIVFTKGSPEKIMAMCSISDDEKKGIEKAIEQFQNEAKRVIAFAHKVVDDNVENVREKLESNMIYDGFVAISDPVRKEVYDAVDQCRSAGINIKMLTGDNIVTATAIARELKILNENSIVLEAKDIDAMDDNTLKQNLSKISVIARSTPTVKMRVVNAIKEMGNVVAVTGDGINDAPAIKNADVGVAMGITGTEVSKEASDIVLLDDSFATIVKAVQWGRGIYDNFQRFIQFQLTVNLASVVVVLISTLTGLKSPFSAIQLLWINIIMDGPPAIALGLEPIRDNLMKRMPTKRNASIVTKKMIFKIVFSATVMIILFMLQSKLNILNVADAEKSTVLFAMFVMFQIFNSFNSRELGFDSVFKYFLNNKLMLLSMGATFILQILATQYAGGFFNTVPLSANTWLKIVGVSFIVIVAAEIFKIFVRLIKR